MFCHKCGSKSIEGSAFCQKCGAKLIVDDASQQAPVAPTPKPVVSAPVPQSPVSTPSQAPTIAESKKKSKKLLFGIVGVALLAVIAIIIAVSLGSGGDDTDLFQIAQNVSPLTDEGFEATYGDVFRWLMTDRGTRLEQQGDAANLTYSGKVTGGDYPVTVVLRVTGMGSNNARVTPYAMTLNGTDVTNFSDRILSDLFWAHDNRNDYPTFMDYVRWDNENAYGTFRMFLDGQDGNYGGTVAAASPDSGLIGQWEPVSDDFISFFNPLDTEFFSDGTVIAQGNISDITGLWTDSGDGRLSVTDEAGDTYMFGYEISGDRLTLTDSNGDSSVFRSVSGAGGSASQSQTESDMYFVERNDSVSSDELQPSIALHPDGTFTFRVNLLYDMAQASGTYNQFGNQYTLYIMESTFDNYDTFAMEVEGDSLIYRGDDWIGATAPGAVFYKTDGTSVGAANFNQGGSPGSTSTDEVLYNGKPIMNWIGASLPSLRDVFGDPDVEGVVWEGGTYGYKYDDGTTFNKNYDGDYIDAIWGNPATLTFNGSSLDINRDGLVGLFGDPVDESWSEDYGYETFHVRFIYQGEYAISFSLDRPSARAYEFWISEYTP